MDGILAVVVIIIIVEEKLIKIAHEKYPLNIKFIIPKGATFFFFVQTKKKWLSTFSFCYIKLIF